MLLPVLLVLLCGLFWLLCFLGTGTDEKNLKSFSGYPAAVQDRLRQDPAFRDRLPAPSSPAAVFAGNLVLFCPVLLLCGFLLQPAGFWQAFGCLAVLGEGLSLFDLLVVDLLWWRHSPRVRFSCLPEPGPYLDPAPHRASFLRSVPLFLLAALLDALLLSL